MATSEIANFQSAVHRATKNRLGSNAVEDSIYFREELYSDFMKFAFEKRNLCEESKRPVDEQVENEVEGQGDDIVE